MLGSLYETLPDLISSVGEHDFYDQVETCFQQVSLISKFKILCYSKANKPQIISSNDEESELDHLYCESAYLLDPFYDIICQPRNHNLVTLDSITRNDFERSTYYDQFYHRVGWTNESNFIIDVDDDRSICLVYTSDKTPLHQLNRQLTPYLKSVEAAIRKHEELNSCVINSSPRPKTNKVGKNPSAKTNNKVLDQRLKLFGLTKREQEIVGYILQGYSSAMIASLCFVSEGTVKNHRKNIYRKLSIKSQCGLFSKLLN